MGQHHPLRAEVDQALEPLQEVAADHRIDGGAQVLADRLRGDAGNHRRRQVVIPANQPHGHASEAAGVPVTMTTWAPSQSMIGTPRCSRTS